jgi:hypothetical protein
MTTSGASPGHPAPPLVSVVTVTKRPGSIDVTWGGLRRQTLGEFEWILCDELFDWRHEEVAAYVGDERLRHIPAPATGAVWNLHRSYNQALRLCRGRFVVSLQDYIWIPDDGLQRFWEAYEQLGPRALVTGVATLYDMPLEQTGAVQTPLGRISLFARPWEGRPTVMTRADHRAGGEGRFVEKPFWMWELNWGGAPLDTFYELGGFPEEHDDLFYSCDNASVAGCAAALGHRIWVDNANECRLLDHGDLFPKPLDWEERHGRYGHWYRWFEGWLHGGRPRFPHLGDRPGAGAPSGAGGGGAVR